MSYERGDEADARALREQRQRARANYEEFKNARRRFAPGSELDIIGAAELITAEAAEAERPRHDIWLEKTSMQAKKVGELVMNAAVMAGCRGAFMLFGSGYPHPPHKQQTTTQVYDYRSIGNSRAPGFRY